MDELLRLSAPPARNEGRHSAVYREGKGIAVFFWCGKQSSFFHRLPAVSANTHSTPKYTSRATTVPLSGGAKKDGPRLSLVLSSGSHFFAFPPPSSNTRLGRANDSESSFAKASPLARKLELDQARPF